MTMHLVSALLAASSALFAAAKSVDGLVYGEADGQQLTMDYYQPAGRGPHPVVIIIHGGGFVGGTRKNNSEAYCADFLAPAGYAVFSINYRLAPRFPLPAMVEDAERAVRFIRHNAKKWDADPTRIALLGGSAGGYISNMAGLLNAPGNPDARDAVDRESAAVQAVVTLFGPSDLHTLHAREENERFLGPVIREKGYERAVTESSPITHVTSKAPPFLLIHGDKDEAVPFEESTRLQGALRAAGAQCDLIVIPGGPHATGTWHRVPGVPDWERQTVEWLNRRLHHSGPIGEGIRPRDPK